MLLSLFVSSVLCWHRPSSRSFASHQYKSASMLLVEGEKSSHRTSSTPTDNPLCMTKAVLRRKKTVEDTSACERHRYKQSATTGTSIGRAWDASASDGLDALPLLLLLLSSRMRVAYRHPNHQSALTKRVVANASSRSEVVWVVRVTRQSGALYTLCTTLATSTLRTLLLTDNLQVLKWCSYAAHLILLTFSAPSDQ